MNLVNMSIDLLTINQNFYNYVKAPHSTQPKDFTLKTFTQIWSNTSGGFEGIGGSAITTQRTYVFIPNHINDYCLVFFGSRFAYKVPYGETVAQDIKDENMAGAKSYRKRYKDEILDDILEVLE